MEEKLSSWKHDHRSEKLPSLLSLKSSDSLVSLELSLMLEGPDAREPSAVQLSTMRDRESRETRFEKPGIVKLEHLEECLQTFLGPNQNMGPFPSSLAKVKEEPVSTSFGWNQLPGVCTMESSAFPDSISRGRESAEVSGKIDLDELEVRDFLGVNYKMGPVSSTGIKIKGEPMQARTQEPTQEPMPSSLDQSKVSCTLEKIQIALQRSQFNCNAALSCIPTKTAPTKIVRQISSPAAFPTWSMLTNLPLTRPVRTPLAMLPPRPLSPTTSDASSAASTKSSRHSSTSPSAMSFQREERDDLGAHASSSSPSSQAVHSSITQEVQGEASSILVAVGCTTCLMFVMLSRENPTCPKCGSTGLLEILPTSSSPPKRQKLESSNLSKEGRRSWDAVDL